MFLPEGPVVSLAATANTTNIKALNVYIDATNTNLSVVHVFCRKLVTKRLLPSYCHLVSQFPLHIYLILSILSLRAIIT